MKMREWIPDSPLPYDGKERFCDRCGAKIQPPRVTAGFVGSGRIVYGGYYGVPDRDGLYCPECARILVGSKQ